MLDAMRAQRQFAILIRKHVPSLVMVLVLAGLVTLLSSTVSWADAIVATASAVGIFLWLVPLSLL
jgi:hypothetical protein